VAHAHNPSYLGSWDLEDQIDQIVFYVSRPALQIVLKTPSPKYCYFSSKKKHLFMLPSKHKMLNSIPSTGKKKKTFIYNNL
jgi:hypothetical protein